MGLKQLLEQGQTQLSVGSFPGDTPINDPQSGFVQENSSRYTYENEIIGQPNNGSILINTLDETSLDTTDSNPQGFNLNTDTITVYPAENVTGVTGSAAHNYNQVWSSTNAYYKYMKENYEVR